MILWQPHCALRVVRTTAYLKAMMEVYGKRVTGLGPVAESCYMYYRGTIVLFSCVHYVQVVGINYINRNSTMEI